MSKIKLSKNFIKNTVKLALNEDLYPSGDITSDLIKKNRMQLIKNTKAGNLSKLLIVFTLSIFFIQFSHSQTQTDFIGTIVFAFPVLYFLFIKSIPFIERSWSVFEKSAEVGGLPGLFLYKSVLLVFCILFGFQFLALMIKSFRNFFHNTDQ